MSLKSESYGYRIVPRAEIFSTIALQCYAGATRLTTEVIAIMHAEQSLALMQRVAKLPGEFVLFNPDGDAEDFVLIGDSIAGLDAEAFEHELSMRA